MPDSIDRPNPTWRALPGGIQHAFDNLAANPAPALCGRKFLPAKLVEPTDDDLKCLACAMKHGSDLADHSGIGMPGEGDTNPHTGGNPLDL